MTSSMICKLCQSSNVERRGVRWDKEGEKYARLKCNECGKWSKALLDYDNVPQFERTLDELGELLNADAYLITSVQNNTPLDLKFWKALKRYAKYKKAQLLVIPLLYRNPTSPGELQSEDAWYPPEVVPYLVENEFSIFSGCRVMGDAKINATAINPLTGFESMTGPDSAIFGHAQIQMKMVATPQNKLPKQLLTTGSCSTKNYSKSKAGKKGDFHHSLGAAIIEKGSESIFHIRSIVGDHQSEFYDINTHVTDRSVKKVKVEAIVLGDEHVNTMCPDVKAATFTDKDSIVNTCKPKFIVRHDVIDSYAITHHHRQSPSIRFKKNLQSTDRLVDELEETARHIEETTPKWATSVVVPSNHHEHITRWLEEVDWRTEPWNAKIYHQMWAAWLDAIEKGEDFSPYPWWMKRNCSANVLYLTNDYPFIVRGIYLGYHGDRGMNGARGTPVSFSKIGAKTVTGHSHTPGVEKGAYAVGTSTYLNLEYTHGPSSWMNSHALIFPNGKRQLIHIIDGEWRG